MSEPTLTEEDREALLCDCASSLAEHCPVHSDDDSVWVDVPASEMAERVERIVARHRAEAAAAERERWVDALSPLCDDEWLRLRDRAMDMPDTKTHQWMRRGSSAWERAARDVRGVLNDLADYEDQYVDQHAAYMRWLRDGRDRAAVAQGREDAR